MNRQINPDRLKAARNRRRLSQKQLAAETGFEISTISRWERDQVPRPRADNLRKLSDALGVTEEWLCSADDPNKADAVSESQITLKVDDACRNALALTARRYGIQQRHIVEMAPFLLDLLAEMSLQERRNDLEADYDSLLRLASNAGQMAKTIPHPDELAGNPEEKSISNQDIFARYKINSLDNPEIENPFSNYVSKKYGRKIWWDGDSSPRYEICIDQVRDLVGHDDEAVKLILEGWVLLASMPADTRKSTPETRAAWVKKESERLQKEWSEQLVSPDGLVENILAGIESNEKEKNIDPSHPEYFGNKNA